MALFRLLELADTTLELDNTSNDLAPCDFIIYFLKSAIIAIVAHPFTLTTQLSVMNRLDPIEELYEMYLEEEDAPRIVEIEDNGLDFLSDVGGPTDPYMDL